jgi:hypothetical protein
MKTLSLYEDLLANGLLEEPGQFTITNAGITCKGGYVNITEMVESINLYESIFKTFVTGDITLLDRTNFAANITGTEPVYLEFSTKGSVHPVKVSLVVSKVKDKEKVNVNITRYTLSLVSPEFLNNIRTKISKSFEGNYSDIVKTIYSDYISSGVPLWLEEVINNNRIIVPNKSPVDAINMISQFAVAKNTVNPNFVFYQTTKSFHFRSIAEMIWLDNIKSEGITFRIEKEQISTNLPIIKRATRAIEFEVKSDTDILKHTAIGTYGSSLIKHNLLKKTWTRTEWDYHSKFGDTEEDAFMSVEEFPVTPDGPVTESGENISSFPDSYFNMVSGSEEYQYEIEPIKTDSKPIKQFQKLDYSSSLLQRNGELNSLNIQRAKLTIGGMSGIQAGDIIKIKYHDMIGENTKLSGRWLIESVSHQISDKYYCVLMIIRNSVKGAQSEYTELNYPESTTEVIIASPSGSTNK